MRLGRIGLGIIAFGLLSATASTARAQGGFSDPFFLYYGYFLPRQNALATQAQPEDLYRAQAAARSYAASVDRSGLYDPGSAIGLDELDPNRAYGTRTGSTNMVRTNPSGLVTSISRTSHSAPRTHFARHGSYYPGIRGGGGPAVRRGSSGAAGIGVGAPRGRGMQPAMSVPRGVGGGF
jgi:hypothetical protein